MATSEFWPDSASPGLQQGSNSSLHRENLSGEVFKASAESYPLVSASGAAAPGWNCRSARVPSNPNRSASGDSLALPQPRTRGLRTRRAALPSPAPCRLLPGRCPALPAAAGRCQRAPGSAPAASSSIPLSGPGGRTEPAGFSRRGCDTPPDPERLSRGAAAGNC